MAKKAGALWIHGDTLHYIDQYEREWAIFGTYWMPTTGKPGSLWVDGPHVFYINEAGNAAFYASGVLLSPVSGKAGSLWVEDVWLRWIDGIAANTYYGHNDVAGGGGHVDSPHFDSGHGDVHGDGSHGDYHHDISHSDGHGDSHSDSTHGDGHDDQTIPGNSTHYDSHNDTMDEDYTLFCYDYDHGVEVGHGDHIDEGGPYVHHCDNHDDYPVTSGSHGDSHSDSAHNDTHSDSPHQDAGHGDAHNDSSHDDTHSDTGHQDVVHSDHIDGATGHGDSPLYIGP